MTTDDVKRFAAEHFGAEELERIEWIDDTSANLVYRNEEIGLRALEAFTQQLGEEGEALPPLRLRMAKSLSTHPDAVLQVRSAVKTDRKKPRAYQASRFYLLHPEHDPLERLQRQWAERRRSGHREKSQTEYKRNRFDEQEHRRRLNHGYSEAMYDDDNADASERKNVSMSAEASEDERWRRPRYGRQQHQQQRKELFPDKVRSRSASPDAMRRPEEEGLNDDAGPHATSRRRFRERSPRRPPAGRNAGKELFPTSSTTTNGLSSSFFSSSSYSSSSSALHSSIPPASSSFTKNAREVFPNKTAASFMKRELFPNQTNSNHRRSDAFDAADETDPFTKRIRPLAGAASADVSSNEMRIRGGADATTTTTTTEDQGPALRGITSNNTNNNNNTSNNGISIRGAANSANALKELFPSRYNPNAGKELFSDKLEGRGGRRKRAEDMFS